MARAADYPPPFSADEFVVTPTDADDVRIEVGILVVGAGPAGLAFAIRFGQLLESNPEVRERLGDVPLAIVEKGKQAGSHLLSGVIVNPRSLRRLFAERFSIDDIPGFGKVQKESVFVLTNRAAIPIPVPPSMRNHGNYIFSLSQLGRWLAERAEKTGALVLPETSAHTLLLDKGRVVGIRTGDKGRDSHGNPLPNFEPGVDIVAQITVLADGTQGHLSGVALDHFNLRGGESQTWELGVKEVWKVTKPLPGIIHTMGWPLRSAAKYREFGGSFVYPMGDDMVTIGMVAGLDYRDADLSVHDLLQELKTHPKLRPIFDGGERIEWGAKTIPGGGFYSLPTGFSAPGLLLCGDGVGMVNVPSLKGVHYAIESGCLAAETAFESVTGGSTDLAHYDSSVRESFIWHDLHAVRDVRQVFGRGFFVGGALSAAITATNGALSVGRVKVTPDDEAPLLRSGRAARYPAPDGTLTFDKLSSVYLSGNKTRDDQPNHIRLQRRIPVDVAEMWVRLCPAHVYTLSGEAIDGMITIEISPSNCVQCGAISAKGGRLTPPEGGSGPEYTLT